MKMPKHEFSAYATPYGNQGLLYRLSGNAYLDRIAVPGTSGAPLVITTTDLVLDAPNALCKDLPGRIHEELSAVPGVTQVKQSLIGPSGQAAEFSVYRDARTPPDLKSVFRALSRVASPEEPTGKRGGAAPILSSEEIGVLLTARVVQPMIPHCYSPV